jgi:DNA-binding transcriptional LysR family regulator
MDMKLKVLCTVARLRSFSAAAEELYISQPAVSKHVQSLETELGLALLERRKNNLSLTPAGQLVVQHAEKILAQYREMENDLSLLSETLQGQLTIGASTTIAQYILPPVLARFKSAHPTLAISLLTGNSAVVERWLGDHKTDIGIIEGLPAHHPDFRYTPFLEDELVAIVPSGSRWSQLRHCTIEQLQQIPLVVREKGSGTLEVFEDYLKSRGTSLKQMNVLMQLGSTESIKLFLKHTEAAGIVSRSALTESATAEGFTVLKLDAGSITRHFHLVQHKGAQNKIVRLFTNYLLQHYNQKL